MWKCNEFPLISGASRNGRLPLAVAQEGFWKLEQVFPGCPFSIVFSTFRMVGELNEVILDRVFEEIARRHEILRTHFIILDGHPIQVISPAPIPGLIQQDLSALSIADCEDECVRHIIHEAKRRFDLIHGPLFRATLLTLTKSEYLLIITMHHIISDAWSIEVFVSEMASLYKAFAMRRPSPLPELAVQYGDFAVWQRESMQKGAMDNQLAYWKARLSDGDLPHLNLPFDYPRQSSTGLKTSGQSVVLTTPLSLTLKSLGHREGVTLFMTLLSILKIALHGFTRQDDICVGTLVTSRSHEQLEPMIGLFTNTVVLRTDLRGNPSIREVMERVRGTVLGAYEHQDLPFETLVQALEHDCKFERARLFRVLFLFGNRKMPSLRMGDVDVQFVDLGTGMLEANADFSAVTTFDLILSLSDRPEGVTGSLVYNSGLFSYTTISKMVDHFRDIAEKVASNSHQRLSTLPPFVQSRSSYLPQTDGFDELG
jgi:hypothetical protein